MKIPKYFREWFINKDISRSNMWSWTDIDKPRLLIIAWAAYQKGIVAGRNKEKNDYSIYS